MMNSIATSKSYQLPAVISIFLGPALMMISTFFWKDGQYGIQGGALVILASIFWIAALPLLFNLLSPKYPRYAAWGWLVSTIGFASGICFGFLGMMAEIFKIPHQQYIAAFAQHPLETNLVLFWPGPLAPLSLLALGIQLYRSRMVPGWTAVLICLGAIAFPLSRISRIEWVAHVSDLLQFIPLSYIGWNFSFRPQK